MARLITSDGTILDYRSGRRWEEQVGVGVASIVGVAAVTRGWYCWSSYQKHRALLAAIIMPRFSCCTWLVNCFCGLNIRRDWRQLVCLLFTCLTVIDVDSLEPC